MSIFRSQFERARAYSEEFAGDARDPAWRSPTVIAAVVGGGAAVAAAAIPVVAGDDNAGPGNPAAAGEKPAAAEEGAGDAGAWGDESWESGWDAPAAPAAPAATDGGPSWMDRGEYTDAAVGGDEDFFYFIDGDSSAAIG